MDAAKTGGSQKGAHPFQLLEWAVGGDGRAVAQFRENVEAFTERRTLTSMPALKGAHGVNEREQTDE
ncbi:hypothetical protein [Burkholderia diffusa]|uniref:hypothetical protein n=1 Tax=Burkholderia diffusa TaxID=488732 RepID=UPI00075F0BE2|nr:hypothetical protein [Burkholderia diffusa]KVM96719.1 hypothetical protein WJ62_22245 [Burkholderia diffusa]